MSTNILSKIDRDTFFANYLPLLFYAAVYEGLMPQSSIIADFKNTSLQTKADSRDVLFTDKDVLNYYLSDNKHILDNKAIEFIREVSIGLLSEFIVLKQKKEYAVLLEIKTNRFYEVVNITDPFNEMLKNLPVQIKSAIFNFNGKIICDGLVVGGNIHIGRGMTSTFLHDYNEATKTNKVIRVLK